jgi:peptidoglycan/LPS O-acetylase OafA/YrhL
VKEQDKHVWRPDIFGSTLFLVASAFGILAVGGFSSARPRSLPWRIAWLNMFGSILFMAAALAGYIVPSSGDVLNIRVDVAGTLLGALFFLIGAALMFPAWRQAVQERSALRRIDPLPEPHDQH